MTVQSNDTIYVEDPDAKKFYEMQNHDAMCLQVGDLVYLGEGERARLSTVLEVIRKRDFRTVRLDNGYQFDPSSSRDNDALRRITFWRPRKGF